MSLTDTFRKIGDVLSGRSAPVDPVVLQEMFRGHYRSFRSLLTANNNALELMAEIEQALTLGQPFGMAFVRGNCTAVSVNVYKMIQNLQALSGGKYPGLLVAFKEISTRIEEILERHPEAPAGDYILPLSGIGKNDTDLVGDKMANLGEAQNRVGLKVPPGFIVTSSATRFFMESTGLQDEINRLLKTVDLDDLESLYTTSAQIQRLISHGVIPAQLADQILENYDALGAAGAAGPLISMRSSAVEEDRINTSFAGQFRTQLNVNREFLLQTYKDIVASKYMSQAIVYRHQRGFRHQDVMMCVGCLVMVDAVVSGVMFSRSSRNPRSNWLEINAAPGLASQVVDGSARTDFFMVGREAPFKIIHQKTVAPDPVLTEEQFGELVAAAVRLEDHFGTPQDIEWSIDRAGQVVILQSRPLARPVQIETANDNGVTDAPDQSALLCGGLTASRGVASGPVFKVASNVDLLEFPRGAVLVVESPVSEWASLLGRAAAVISETGHGATHLAIVAREFGTPAIFSLKDAFGKLKNGDIVTVDATGFCVYEGRREDILEKTDPPRNLMAGSPIYNLLQEIMAQVVPLNLTDPGSPFFKSSQCKTLHDLTRFCHEKAVTEMFSFGESARFDARAAKQLVGETPFQWWVIDLDDGFRTGFDPKEKFISVDDIVSDPMLAIWEGMLARPWRGPPPVSMKGFGSILFRSTMNPSLDPAVRSSMAAKNYFLISKKFCNLNMRLGYHFTLVEAFLGSLLTENYVSFQFRGGAANRSRRFIRVLLLRDILKQYGFRVDVKDDALTARIEKMPKEYLIERLKVIGYLLIHTRQIDMAMGDQDMVDDYRQKIETDLAGIVAIGPQMDED